MMSVTIVPMFSILAWGKTASLRPQTCQVFCSTRQICPCHFFEHFFVPGMHCTLNIILNNHVVNPMNKPSPNYHSNGCEKNHPQLWQPGFPTLRITITIIIYNNNNNHWLVVWNIFFLHILEIIIPID